MISKIFFIVFVTEIAVAAIPPTGKDLENNPFYRRDFVYYDEFKSFYKLHKDAVTRSEAESLCLKEGADLFVPDTPAELSHLNVKLNLDVVNVTGIFVGDANQCARFLPDIQISSIDCQTKLPFICKRKLSSLKYNAICQTWDPAYFLDSTKSRCYKVHPKLDSWNDGFAACHAEHSYMAVINSQTEANLFEKELNKYPRLHENYHDYWDGAWLGFHNLFIDSEFRTINGEMLSMSGYARWDKLQPSGGEHCGQMIRDGLLNDRNCDAIDVFICEREINNFTSAGRRNERCGFKSDVNNATIEMNSSSSDYPTQYQSNFYKLHSDLLTWAEAEQRCRSEGALLAVPESRQEANVMLKLLQEQTPENTESLFVGIHGIFSDGVFVTLEGLDVSMVHNEWSSQNRTKYKDCVTLERDGLYRSVYCHKKKPFICKKNMAEFYNVPCTIDETGYFPGVQDNIYYKLFEEESNWEDANEICHRHNAVLSQMSNPEMVSLLANHLDEIQVGKPQEKQPLYHSVHIDKIISCSGCGNDTFHTVQDFLNGYKSEDQCNFLHSDGVITDGSCNKQQYFYCQLDTKISNKSEYVDPNAIY